MPPRLLCQRFVLYAGLGSAKPVRPASPLARVRKKESLYVLTQHGEVGGEGCRLLWGSPSNRPLGEGLSLFGCVRLSFRWSQWRLALLSSQTRSRRPYDRQSGSLSCRAEELLSSSSLRSGCLQPHYRLARSRRHPRFGVLYGTDFGPAVRISVSAHPASSLGGSLQTLTVPKGPEYVAGRSNSRPTTQHAHSARRSSVPGRMRTDVSVPVSLTA
jgi:hypothetical protein